VAVTLGAPVPSQLDGTVSLAFRPNAAGVTDGYRDPAMQFAAGGTAVDFSIPAGAATASLPAGGALQQGTVAGDIVISISRLAANQNNVLTPSVSSQTVTVPRQAPVIAGGSVRLANVTNSGFTVELTGYSTTRDLASATLAFTAANGASLQGAAVTVPLGPAAVTWFASDSGRANGSRFSLQVPFTLTGDNAALGGVSVTLSNSMGTSAAVSGGR
jgi:hypothetical protein